MVFPVQKSYWNQLSLEEALVGVGSPAPVLCRFFSVLLPSVAAVVPRLA